MSGDGMVAGLQATATEISDTKRKIDQLERTKSLYKKRIKEDKRIIFWSRIILGVMILLNALVVVFYQGTIVNTLSAAFCGWVLGGMEGSLQTTRHKLEVAQVELSIARKRLMELEGVENL